MGSSYFIYQSSYANLMDIIVLNISYNKSPTYSISILKEWASFTITSLLTYYKYLIQHKYSSCSIYTNKCHIPFKLHLIANRTFICISHVTILDCLAVFPIFLVSQFDICLPQRMMEFNIDKQANYYFMYFTSVI